MTLAYQFKIKMKQFVYYQFLSDRGGTWIELQFSPFGKQLRIFKWPFCFNIGFCNILHFYSLKDGSKRLKFTRGGLIATIGYFEW